MTFRATTRLFAAADKYGASLVVYGGVSIASALAEWGSFAVVLPLVGALWAALIGFLIATGVNYVLSRYFAFRSVRSLKQELTLVVAMSALAFAVNFAAFYSLFRYGGVEPLHAKMLGTCVGFAFNYSIRQFLIFSRMSRFTAISAMLKGQEPGIKTEGGASGAVEYIAVPGSSLEDK